MDQTIRDGEKQIIPAGIDDEQTVQQVPVIDSGLSNTAGNRQAPSVTSIVGTTLSLNGVSCTVERLLGNPSGEAEIYLVKYQNNEAVLKHYYQNFKPKEDVLRQLKGINHPDIIGVIDYGWYNNRFFELMCYAAGGNLLERDNNGKFRYLPVKDINKIEQIVKEVVNALQYCHSLKNPIVHRDIKPHNIFYKESNGSDILIGDFGISSLLDSEISKIMTGTARTAIYSAPELNYNIGGKTVIGREVDYYSLGITIIHLWTGEIPFAGLGDYEIAHLKISELISFPSDMPDRLQRLVKGLITKDTKQRWGYDKVREWLDGKQPLVHYGKSSLQNLDEFIFDNIAENKISARTLPELATLLEKYPPQGVRHLYKGTIAKWIEKADQALYVKLRSIVEDDYPDDEKSGLVKAMYVLDPKRNFTTKGGKICKNISEIADALLAERAYYQAQFATDQNDPLFIFIEVRGDKPVADAFRNYLKLYTTERALNKIILDLHGGLKGGDQVYKNAIELATSSEVSSRHLNQYAKDMANPDSLFSIWLEKDAGCNERSNDCKKINAYTINSVSYVLNPSGLRGSIFRFSNSSKGLSQKAVKGAGDILILLFMPFWFLFQGIYKVIIFIGKFMYMFIHPAAIKKMISWAIGMALTCGIVRSLYFTWAWNGHSFNSWSFSAYSIKAGMNGALAGGLAGVLVGMIAGVEKSRSIIFR